MLLIALMSVTIVALSQISRTTQLQSVTRLFWVVFLLALPPIGVPVWFAYGLPGSRQLHLQHVGQ